MNEQGTAGPFRGWRLRSLGDRDNWTVKRMFATHDHGFSARLRRLVLACAGGVLLAAPLAWNAHAQQAQDDEDTFEQRVIKNILGGMGVDVGRAGIDYRERSPLVIPPTRDLPPPQSSNVAATSPAWPRDQQRHTAAVENRPNLRASPEEPGTSSLLTPDELRRGNNPRAPRITDPSQSGSEEDPNVGRPMRPDELNPGGNSVLSWSGLMGGGLRGEHSTFTSEPTRSTLTQPPPGYQTPSPNQPYGVGEERGSGWKIPTILDRPVGNYDQ